MATVTLSFTHPSGNLDKTVTLPDAHMVRLFDAYRAYFIETERLPSITNAQIFDKLFAAMVTAWRSRVSVEERKAAEATATVGITPISI